MALQKIAASVTDYRSAVRFLGSRERRKLAHNTWVEHICPDAVAIRYHQTRIITYLADGSIILNNGGWDTVTTRDRLNLFTPSGIHIWRLRGEPHVTCDQGHIPFLNGMNVGTVQPESQSEIAR